MYRQIGDGHHCEGKLLVAILVSAAIGLTIEADVKPQQIVPIFSIIVFPITFLECVYYPWTLLAKIRWLKIAVLFRPVVYTSERPCTVIAPGIANPPTSTTK